MKNAVLAGALMASTLFWSGQAAQAQSTNASSTNALSAKDAAILAGPCANCHGTDGKSSGPIPPLAGRPASTLAALLKAYKGETPPPGTTIMNRLAKGYSDEQIEALAKYFAEKK